MGSGSLRAFAPVPGSGSPSLRSLHSPSLPVTPIKNNTTMKAIFIAFDQAYYERIVEMLPRLGCRGFTAWQEVQGRGSKTGDPHYGTHAWPSLASAMMTMVPDERVDSVLDFLHGMDVETPKLGLRAWVLPIERSI